MADTDGEFAALLSSASLVFVGAIVASLSKLIERIIIGRALSVEAYGTVSVALAILALSTTVSMAGFTQGIPRFMARFDGDEEIRGSWVTGLVTTGLVSLVVSVVLYLSGDVIISKLFDAETPPKLLYLFLLTLPLFVGFKATVSGIRGRENTVYKLLVSDLLFPFSRAILLVGFLVLGYGILAAGYAYVVATTVALIAALISFNRLFPLLGPVKLHVREMILFSLPLLFSTILSVLLTRTDTLMLGYLASSTAVGIYSAAYPLATGLLIILSSFGFLYLPLASRLDANGKREEINTIYKLTTKWIYVVTFPAFLAFVVFPADVLRIFFDQRYTQGALALSILSVGFFTNAAFGRNRETMSALGKTGFILVANATVFALNIGLNLVLIPRYSYNGAAAASAISYVSLNLLIYAFLKYQLDISPLSHHSLRTYLVLPVVFVPPAVFLSKWVTLSIVTLLIFLVVTGLLALVVIAITGCLESDDRHVLEALEAKTGLNLTVISQHIPN